MTTTPPGWTSTTLGTLGRYMNGRAFKKTEWAEDAGRPIIRIQNLTGTSATYNYFQGEVEDRYVARPGDLLVSWAATLGAYIWNGPEAVVNQHIFKVESNIDVRFHKYLLDYKLAELMRHTHGSGMVHITRSRFDAVHVAVPSVDEQRFIVEILDDHISRLDASIANLRTAQSKVEAWRRSSIDSAVWSSTFQSDCLPVSELLSEKMRNGHSARASASGRGPRTLTLTAVTRNSFTDEFTKIADADERRVRDLWLEPGDVLVQRSNTPELVGSAAIYNGPINWAIFPDLLIRLRADQRRLSSEYLAAVMRTERAHRFLRARAKGLAGSMPKIDQATIGALRIPVPAPAVQAGVVARVATIEDACFQVNAQVEMTVRRAMNLRRALLGAAFRGLLTSRLNDQHVFMEELARV